MIIHFDKLNELGSDRDSNGAYLIDRSPILFEHVLNYLRTNKLIYETQQQLQAILLEAEFYNLQVIIFLFDFDISNRIDR